MALVVGEGGDGGQDEAALSSPQSAHGTPTQGMGDFIIDAMGEVDSDSSAEDIASQARDKMLLASQSGGRDVFAADIVTGALDEGALWAEGDFPSLDNAAPLATVAPSKTKVKTTMTTHSKTTTTTQRKKKKKQSSASNPAVTPQFGPHDVRSLVWKASHPQANVVAIKRKQRVTRSEQERAMRHREKVAGNKAKGQGKKVAGKGAFKEKKGKHEMETEKKALALSQTPRQKEKQKQELKPKTKSQVAANHEATTSTAAGKHMVAFMFPYLYFFRDVCELIPHTFL